MSGRGIIVYFAAIMGLASCAQVPPRQPEPAMPRQPAGQVAQPPPKALEPVTLKTKTQVLMGTAVSVALPSAHIDFAELVFAQFRDAEKRFSIYGEGSEISRLNQEGHLTLSDETLALIVRAQELSRQTKGAFDITLGRLTHSLYGLNNAGRSDEPEAVYGYEKLKIKGQTVQMPEGMALDLGGIAKGYAVDRSADRLIRAGVKDGFVAASGDIRCLHPCRISIQHPFERNRDLVDFRARQSGLSISTSGTFEQMAPGSDIHHLLDPKTGKPQRNFVGVTLVTSQDNTTIDALATAVISMPLDRAVTFLSTCKEVGFVVVTADNWLFYNQKFLDLTEGLVWRGRPNEFKMILLDGQREKECRFQKPNCI